MSKRYMYQKEGPQEWSLKGFGDTRAVKTFSTKEEGLDFVRGMTGPRSVLIRNPYTGRFKEERTYPRSADPRRFPG